MRLSRENLCTSLSNLTFPETSPTSTYDDVRNFYTYSAHPLFSFSTLYAIGFFSDLDKKWREESFFSDFDKR